MHLTFLEYKTLVEQAPILIWRSGLDKRCNYFNAQWLHFTGRTMDEESGDGWTEGVHPDDFQACLKTYVESFDRRDIFEMRYRLRRHDGEYRWIFDRGAPFYDDQNIFQGYIGSCIDVTEAVHAETELQRINEEKIHDLETLLPMCAWCKRLRNDSGDWIQIEDFIHESKKHSITHSICPECKRHELDAIKQRK